MSPEALKSPYPYFGGKRRIAAEVWNRFGNVENFVEPFFGSGAVLLARPWPWNTETVNDKDCYISNFWRAVQKDPLGLARECDWPINETDLHPRHRWLIDVGAPIIQKCKVDPDFFDLKVAAWWVWGISLWIGGEWCKKPWQTRPNLTCQNGIHIKRPRLSGWGEVGVHKPHDLVKWFKDLQDRLRRVRVICGDWRRVTSPSCTTKLGTTAVFLDPPYTRESGRDNRLYAQEDLEVGKKAAAWAFEHGNNPKLRIALCGYAGEYKVPKDWKMVAWKASGGFSNTGNDGKTKANRLKERIWFSPHCPEPQPNLF